MLFCFPHVFPGEALRLTSSHPKFGDASRVVFWDLPKLVRRQEMSLGTLSDTLSPGWSLTCFSPDVVCGMW